MIKQQPLSPRARGYRDATAELRELIAKAEAEHELAIHGVHDYPGWVSDRVLERTEAHVKALRLALKAVS